jgi:D-arabinose 1-dehydrogenase-like Zn-dependent alcohol dehydrogenase
VFRDIKLVGTLVGRNAQSRAILIFAAKHGVRAKMKTYSLERLNELVGDYHRGPKRSIIVAISTREVHAHKVGMPKDARPWDARLEDVLP